MANVVITKTGNSIVVAFNDYASSLGFEKESFDIRDIVEVSLVESDAFVQVTMRDAHGVKVWSITYDSAYGGSEYLIVDSVATVAPSSESDLFDKITALRG